VRWAEIKKAEPEFLTRPGKRKEEGRKGRLLDIQIGYFFDGTAVYIQLISARCLRLSTNPDHSGF
jgi:hypothetical protein